MTSMGAAAGLPDVGNGYDGYPEEELGRGLDMAGERGQLLWTVSPDARHRLPKVESVLDICSPAGGIPSETTEPSFSAEEKIPRHSQMPLVRIRGPLVPLFHT